MVAAIESINRRISRLEIGNGPVRAEEIYRFQRYWPGSGGKIGLVMLYRDRISLKRDKDNGNAEFIHIGRAELHECVDRQRGNGEMYKTTRLVTENISEIVQFILDNSVLEPRESIQNRFRLSIADGVNRLPSIYPFSMDDAYILFTPRNDYIIRMYARSAKRPQGRVMTYDDENYKEFVDRALDQVRHLTR